MFLASISQADIARERNNSTNRWVLKVKTQPTLVMQVANPLLLWIRQSTQGDDDLTANFGLETLKDESQLQPTNRAFR